MKRRREVGGCDEGTLSVRAPISENVDLLRRGVKGAEAVSFRLAGQREVQNTEFSCFGEEKLGEKTN